MARSSIQLVHQTSGEKELYEFRTSVKQGLRLGNENYTANISIDLDSNREHAQGRPNETAQYAKTVLDTFFRIRDLSTVSAITAGKVLYLHFDIGQQINLQNGKESDGTLKLQLGANGETLEVDFRKRTVTDGTSEHIGWQAISFQCLPTYACNKYEMRFDLSSLGVSVGDTVSLQFAGSDSLKEPVKIVMAESVAHRSDVASLDKPPGVFRIVNQNTLQNGLASTERQEKFRHLFRSVNADVYCFQEEWSKDKFMDGVVKTVPRNGKSINYVWGGGCAIATTHKMLSLPMKLDRAVAGLVTFPGGETTVVISAHFKCCGFAGSKEDGLRVQQAEQIVGAIKKMRQGDLGVITPSTPVVLIGDFNLVGSRKPLDIINAAGLKDVVCLAADGSASTWRGLEPDESFWPGRLDIAATTGFQSVNGQVFDCRQLSRTQYTNLMYNGLQWEDSEASDHLMLILDCVF